LAAIRAVSATNPLRRRNDTMPRRWGSTTPVAIAAAWILLVPASMAGTPPTREQVLAQFDRVQGSVRTLSADFTETTRTPLLTEPMVARGRVYLTKPTSVRWEYTEPEEMRFVIADDQYTGYYPSRKQAERRDVHRWREQLFRLLGLGQASSELSKFYDIELGDAGGSTERLLLVLDPKKKRVRKHMDSVRLWIDASTYLPVEVEYQGKNGSRRVIAFTAMTVNPELAASLYRVDLPDDVTVTKGFSALSGLSAASDN
jgi:outer membrane lipoprotein-sorting protein